MTDQRTPGRKATRNGASVRMTAAAPALLVLLIGIGVGDLLLFAVGTNIALNGTIIGLTVLAVGMAYLRAADIDLDRRELWRIAENRERADPKEHAYILNGPLADAFAMIQRSATNDGHRTFQTAVDRETDFLRSNLNQRLAVLQYMTGLLISLGLLGTFLGLLRTLVASSAVLDAVGVGVGSSETEDATEMFSGMIMSLKAPLTNMGTAFSSSLFGLVGSITVGVMVLILQRAGNTTVSRFRDLMLSSRDWLFTFKQDESIDAAIVHDILTAMLERERLAIRRADDVLDGFQASLSVMAEASARIDAVGTHLGNMTEQLAGLPQWCAHNYEVAEALQQANKGILRLVSQVDLLGESRAASSLRAESQRDTIRQSLDGLRGELHSQSENAKVVADNLVALTSRTASISAQLDGLLRGSEQSQTLSETIVNQLTVLAELAEALKSQSASGLDSLLEICGELTRQSTFDQDILAQAVLSAERIDALSSYLEDLVTASKQSQSALKSLDKSALDIVGSLTRVQAQGAALEPLVRLVDDMSIRLRDLVENQAVESEAAQSFRNNIASSLAQTEQQLQTLNASTTKQLTITEEAAAKGFAALTLIREELQRLDTNWSEQQMIGQQAVKLLSTIDNQLGGVTEHLAQIVVSVPTQQRSLTRLENLLSPIQRLETLSSEQISILDRLAARLGHFEDFCNLNDTVLGELSSGVTSQIQILASLLEEHRLQAERNSSLTLSVEQTYAAMLRVESAITCLPKADLIVDQAKALASHFVHMENQFNTLLSSQSDLKAATQEANDLLSQALEESKNSNLLRSNALKQMIVAIVKIADSLETTTWVSESQLVLLRDLGSSMKMMQEGLSDLAEYSAKRDEEPS